MFRVLSSSLTLAASLGGGGGFPGFQDRRGCEVPACDPGVTPTDRQAKLVWLQAGVFPLRLETPLATVT